MLDDYKADSDWLTSWVAEFNKVLRHKEWASAKLVLRRFRDAGCDVDWLMNLVVACTHPHPKIANPLATQTKSQSRNLLRRLERLQTLISTTQQALQDLEAEPYAEHFRPLETAIFQVDLPVVLTSVGNLLNHPKLGITSLRRAFDARKIPSSLALVMLCAYVRRITGGPLTVRLYCC